MVSAAIGFERSSNQDETARSRWTTPLSVFELWQSRLGALICSPSEHGYILSRIRSKNYQYPLKGKLSVQSRAVVFFQDTTCCTDYSLCVLHNLYNCRIIFRQSLYNKSRIFFITDILELSRLSETCSVRSLLPRRNLLQMFVGAKDIWRYQSSGVPFQTD